MHQYLEMFQFTDMTFLDSIRKLLRAFGLPGEAQKIDRFMLKFAEIFVKDNPDVFKTAGLEF
jgi:brefeldin A-inhibited guanine nucleotide-exchange protein